MGRAAAPGEAAGPNPAGCVWSAEVALRVHHASWDPVRCVETVLSPRP